MTNNDEKRKAILTSVLETLDEMISASKAEGDEILTKPYLLGAYTVLNMLGIATNEEFNTLCDYAL